MSELCPGSCEWENLINTLKLPLVPKHLWTIQHLQPPPSRLGSQHVLLHTRPISSGLEIHKTWSLPHTTQISSHFSFLCFKYTSEKEARAAVNTQEPHSYLAPSVSGISPAEWSQRKPTAKTIWFLLCGNVSKTPGNLCFLQAAPVHTGGFLRGH